jgi:hypothetical protein
MEENETLMTQTLPEGALRPGSQASGTDTDQGGASRQGEDGKKPENEADEGEPEKKPEGDAPQKKPEGAPEKYDFTAPEGIEVSDAVFGSFSEVAKELNLPQDKAQAVIDKMIPAIAGRHAERMEAVAVEWANSAKADREFGGEKLPENLSVAKKALDAFATPELRALLKESGLGNHPEIIRLFYRTGKAISEDGFVPGRSSKEQGKSMEERLYPNEFKRS